jgi:hypothetical protein
MTDGEIDVRVDALKADLEALRTKMKAALQRARQETMPSLRHDPD